MPNRYGATAKANEPAIKEALRKPAEDYLSKENLDAAIDLLERYEYFAAATELEAKCAKLWNTDGTRRRPDDPIRVGGEPLVGMVKEMATRAAGAQAAVDEIIGPGPRLNKADAGSFGFVDHEKERALIAEIDADIDKEIIERRATAEGPVDEIEKLRATGATPDYAAERTRRKPRIVGDPSAEADADLIVRKHIATSKSGIPYEYRDKKAVPEPAPETTLMEPVDLGAVAWIDPGSAPGREGITGMRVNRSRIRLPRRFVQPAYAFMRAGFVDLPGIDVANPTLVLEFSAEPRPGFMARHRQKPEWGMKALREGILAAGYEAGDHEIHEFPNCFVVVRTYQP